MPRGLYILLGAVTLFSGVAAFLVWSRIRPSLVWTSVSGAGRGGTDREPGGPSRAESGDPAGHGGARDAEEVGDLLDRGSVENALDGEEPSAL